MPNLLINLFSSDKDLDQIKTTTHYLEKQFKDIKANKNPTEEESVSRIKEKMGKMAKFWIDISLRNTASILQK